MAVPNNHATLHRCLFPNLDPPSRNLGNGTCAPLESEEIARTRGIAGVRAGAPRRCGTWSLEEKVLERARCDRATPEPSHAGHAAWPTASAPISTTITRSKSSVILAPAFAPAGISTTKLYGWELHARTVCVARGASL